MHSVNIQSSSPPKRGPSLWRRESLSPRISPVSLDLHLTFFPPAILFLNQHLSRNCPTLLRQHRITVTPLHKECIADAGRLSDIPQAWFSAPSTLINLSSTLAGFPPDLTYPSHPPSNNPIAWPLRPLLTAARKRRSVSVSGCKSECIPLSHQFHTACYSMRASASPHKIDHGLNGVGDVSLELNCITQADLMEAVVALPIL